MYCNKCGKYIAENAILCDDCKKNIQVEEKVEKTNEQSSKPKKINVRLAISCFVASLVAFVIVFSLGAVPVIIKSLKEAREEKEYQEKKKNQNK
jgi:uncharacterized membrane protein YvbJ